MRHTKYSSIWPYGQRSKCNLIKKCYNYFSDDGPRFISRGHSFRTVVGDTLLLPCQVQNLGKNYQSIFYYHSFITFNKISTYQSFLTIKKQRKGTSLRSGTSSVCNRDGSGFVFFIIFYCISIRTSWYPIYFSTQYPHIAE